MLAATVGMALGAQRGSPGRVHAGGAQRATHREQSSPARDRGARRSPCAQLSGAPCSGGAARGGRWGEGGKGAVGVPNRAYSETVDAIGALTGAVQALDKKVNGRRR